MIPRQIRLSGFMSYGEEMIVAFRGASIWALAGDNGSGKSTLCDAMFYALYGEHRLGSQGAQQLIHHEREALLVELDFASGDAEYRVRRTLTRKANGTRTVQAFPLCRDTVQTEESPEAQPIAETHRERGLRNWVKQVVGLDSQAFTFAVWLQQGRSDALIKASSKERHQMLTQGINLAAYERLRCRAEASYRQWDMDVRNAEHQLRQLEVVEDTRLATVVEGEHQAQAGKQAAQERLMCLTRWGVQAERWWELEAEWQKTHQALLACEEVLARGPQIEDAAQRAAELQEVLPLLQAIGQRRLERGRLEGLLGTLEQEQKHQEGIRTQAKDVYQHGQKAVETNKMMRQQWQEQLKEIQQRVDEKEPAIRELKVLDTLRIQATSLEQQLQAMDPALSENVQRLQHMLNETTALLAVLPWLRQVVTARQQWQQWRGEHALLIAQQEEIAKQLKQSGQEKEILVAHLESLKEQEGLAQQEVIRAESAVKQCEQREKQFRAIDGKATCSYCGQVLTLEHLECERQKVAGDLEQAKLPFQQAQQQMRLLHKQGKKDQEVLQKKQEAYLEMEREHKSRQERCLLLTSQQAQAELQVLGSLRELPASFLRVYWDIQDGQDIETHLQACLRATGPSAEDLAHLEERASHKVARAAERSSLQSTLNRRQSLSTQWEYVCQQLTLYEQRCSPEQQTQVREEYGQVQQERRMLTDHLSAVDQILHQQEQELIHQGALVREYELALGALMQRLAVAHHEYEQTQAGIAERQAALPVPWRELSAEFSPAMFQTWMQEYEVVREAPKLRERLAEARHQQVSYRQRLTELETERERIPPEARRPLNELDHEVKQTTLDYTVLEQEQQRCQKERSDLEGMREQRRHWQQCYQEAKQKALLYKELSRLLGADCLQRYLLQKAERGIVNEANGYLDRISGGTLRLQLGGEADQETKALDLVAYHQPISATTAQSVKLLSGSQQFRVAVSLALGIGTYIGGEMQRVEAVMIDEGFGSLDVKGRRDMVQAIQDLRDILKCIIVVSHQAEIFEEFDHHYHVRLVNGSSHVALC